MFRFSLHAAKRTILFFALLACVFAFRIQSVLAANGINRQITYQARLMDSAGVNVADGTYNLYFSIYSAASGGIPLWTASGTPAVPDDLQITVSSGLFSLQLGNTSGSEQNTLTDSVLWNSDSLYLGVRVGTDSEMVPRKRLTAVPQAFNSEMLQGMYASGTVPNTGGVLFVINQTASDAAIANRVALEIRSHGSSNDYDHFIRGISDVGNTIFSIKQNGNFLTNGRVNGGSIQTEDLIATSTGNFQSNTITVGAVTSSARIYANSVQAPNFIVSTSVLPNTDAVASLGSSSLRFNSDFFNTTSTNSTTTNAYISSSLRVASGTTTTIAGDLLSGTSTFSTPLNALFAMNGDDLYVAGNIGSVSSVYSNGAFVAGSGTSYGNGLIAQSSGNLTLNVAGGSILPSADATIALGSPSLRFNSNFFNTTSTYATTTRLAFGGSVSQFIDLTTLLGTATTTQTNVGLHISSLAVQGSYLYSTSLGNDRMDIFSIKDPSYPYRIGTAEIGNNANPMDVKVDGQYAYVLNQGDGSLKIYDISIPSAPNYQVNFTTSLSQPRSLVVRGSYAYVSNANANYLTAINITNPTAPFLSTTTSFSNGGFIWKIVASGRYLYGVVNRGAGVDGGLIIFDLADPTNPAFKSHTTTTGRDVPTGIDVQGQYVYIVYDGFVKTVDRYDVSTPSAPTLSNTSGLTSGGTGVTVRGRYLYVSNATGIETVDLLRSGNMSTVGLSTTIASSTQAVVHGRYLYVGSNTSSLAVIGIYDIGGTDVNGLSAASAEVGSLRVLDDGMIARDFFVGGTLSLGLGGMTSYGPMNVYASSNSSTAQFVNTGSDADQTTWGLYTNKLLVGPSANTTGTNNYQMILSYDSSTKQGLCLDDASTAGTCPTTAVGSSIVADGSITGNGFDLAERYRMSGSADKGDVVVMDVNTSSTGKRSPGIPYDPAILGVVSTKPAFVLGWPGGTEIALTGRVPTKVSPINGEIRINDPLTTSPYPGVAMKATKPGMIIGRALDNAATTSTIEAFINAHYYTGSLFSVDGTVSKITDHLVMDRQGEASASNPIYDSFALAFRGSAWNGEQPVVSEYIVMNTVTSATSSALTIRDASSTTLFQLNQDGDLAVRGKIYPSARGTMQTEKYLYLDDAQTPSSTYIATNADGWQANSSYDFAERYYSPDHLEPGDLVVVSERGQIHVQRSMDAKQMLVGIVSTRPGFVAGVRASSTYPIALAGRVPTKVSTMNGSITSGDMLAPSSIPGVAVKAIEAGPIVGQALENYNGTDVGKIEAYVNPVWWGGISVARVAGTETETIAVTTPTAIEHRGFAVIAAGATKVHVPYPSLLAYPNVQATPRGMVEGSWWTDGYSDTGFDIFLSQKQMRDLIFAWRVEPTADGEQIYRSDGTYATLNATTGEEIFGSRSAVGSSTTHEIIITEVETPTSTPLAELSNSMEEPVITSPVTLVPEPLETPILQADATSTP